MQERQHKKYRTAPEQWARLKEEHGKAKDQMRSGWDWAKEKILAPHYQKIKEKWKWLKEELALAQRSPRDSFLGRFLTQEWVHSNPLVWMLMALGEKRVFFEPDFVFKDVVTGKPLCEESNRLKSPKEYGLPGFETYILKARNSGNKTECTAWYKKAQEGFPTVMYCHGNAGALDARARIFREFAERGFGVMAVAYPGFKGSRSKHFGMWEMPSESGCVNAVEQAVWALTKSGVPTSSIMFLGESLGSAIAIQAAQHVEQGKYGHRKWSKFPRNIGGLVCVAGFASLPDRVRETLPFFPAEMLMQNQFNAIQQISGLKAEPLFLHGLADKTTGAHHSAALGMSRAGHLAEAKKMLKEFQKESRKAMQAGTHPESTFAKTKELCKQAVKQGLLDEQQMILYDGTNHHFSEIENSPRLTRRKINEMGNDIEAYLLRQRPERWTALKEPAEDRKKRYMIHRTHEVKSAMGETMEMNFGETIPNFTLRLDEQEELQHAAKRARG